ncbi:MAG: restriction endonuclease [Candidatus Nitrosoabyssus spongiisocia]|nr:MAG: restriction endonuclease [Nitrosopumilaceae archaeon AB1(1)]
MNDDKTIMITKKGREILKQNPTRVNLKFLKTLESYKKFIFRYKNKKQNTIQTIKSELSPEEILESTQQTLRTQVENELHQKINSQNFQYFERLVIKVIRAMGYGIEDNVIGKSGDGGIDGIIKEDKLGLDKIYLQAKRWKSSVPVETVRGFAGALSSKSSKKGIFITSSTFSSGTEEFVKKSDNNIILIDGKQLAMYMYEYNIGTKCTTTYTTKQLDNDFFDE